MFSFHFCLFHAILLTRHFFFVVRLVSTSALTVEIMMPNEIWTKCLNDFLRSKLDHSGSMHTVVNYKSVLAHFFADGRDPARATRQDVEDFLHVSFVASTREPSASTRATRLAILSSLYHYASTYMVAGVPLMRGASPTLGITAAVRPQNYRAFTPADLQKFFSVIPQDTVRGARDYAIFMTLFWTARRREEVCSLVYGNIFSGVVMDPDGTRRDAMLYRWHGKNMAEGAYDTSELPEPAYESIRVYLQASGRLATIEDDDPVFIAIAPPHGGMAVDPYRPLGGHSVWNALKKYAKAAQLDFRRLTVHSLRHTSARFRYLVNPDVRDIQQVLRHASIATTDRYVRTLVTPADPTAKLLEERYGYLFE